MQIFPKIMNLTNTYGETDLAHVLFSSDTNLDYLQNAFHFTTIKIHGKNTNSEKKID